MLTTVCMRHLALILYQASSGGNQTKARRALILQRILREAVYVLLDILVPVSTEHPSTLNSFPNTFVIGFRVHVLAIFFILP